MSQSTQLSIKKDYLQTQFSTCTVNHYQDNPVSNSKLMVLPPRDEIESYQRLHLSDSLTSQSDQQHQNKEQVQHLKRNLHSRKDQRNTNQSSVRIAQNDRHGWGNWFKIWIVEDYKEREQTKDKEDLEASAKVK